VSRLTVTTGGGTALTIGGLDSDLAITPDGTRLIYHGPNQLLVRAIDELEPTALGSPGPVRNIFVSADGQSVGFFDGTNALRKVAITGGAQRWWPRPMALVHGAPRGATMAALSTPRLRRPPGCCVSHLQGRTKDTDEARL
jgi:hypothetical protein